MKIFTISDVHCDFYTKKTSLLSPENMKKIFREFKDGENIILVVCGDIGEGLLGVIWCERMLNVFPKLQIIYTPGNHEFYGQNLDELLDYFAIISDSNPKLTILDGINMVKKVIQQNNTPICTFIGGTLWTDFNKNSEYCKTKAVTYMSDYKRIFSGKNKLINPNRVFELHSITKKKIFNEIQKADTNIPIIGVTHHVPFVPVTYSYEDYYYYSDLSNEFNQIHNLPKYWLYGHTHISKVTNQKYTHGDITFISNQVGYPHQINSGFSLNCFIEI